jgi:hypothetical protein
MLQTSVFLSVSLKQTVLHNKGIIHSRTVLYLSCVWEGAIILASELHGIREVTDNKHEFIIRVHIANYEKFLVHVYESTRDPAVSIFSL